MSTQHNRPMPDPGHPTDIVPVWRRALPWVGILAIAGAAYASGLHNYLSLAAVAERRNDLRAYVEAHHLRALALFAVAYLVAVAASLPGALILTLSGGFLFGWLVGGMAAVVAATGGACLVFLLARSALGQPLARRAGPALEKLRAGFSRDAVSYLLFLRLVPAFPFWLVNLAPALLGVSLWTFAWTTFVGIMPATFAFAFAGEGLDAVIATQEAAYRACMAAGGTDCRLELKASALVTRELVLAIAAIGVAALIPIVIRRLLPGRFAPD